MKKGNKKTSSDFVQKLKKLGEKIAEQFKRFALFVGRHKVITSVIVVLVVVILCVVGIVSHFLGKINYVDADKNTASVYNELLTLATGEVVDLSTLNQNADGTYTLPDGRIIDSDGTVWNTDGSIIFYDHSYLTADGVAVLSDGTTIQKDQTVIFQDGQFLSNTGITVDAQGYATFRTGKKAHISTFTINKDGTVSLKDPSLISSKYSSDGTLSVDNSTDVKSDDDEHNALSDAKENPDVKSALDANDEKIRSNFDDKKIWYNDNIMNILVMGIDEGSKAYPYGRSDSMLILSVNKQTKKVKMISLSRAVYVAIQGHENTRLNHAHGLGGAALAIDTIERNYKIRIDNYVSTNFSTFKRLIDVIGGVDIKLSAAEASALKSKIQAQGSTYNGAGTYNLKGELALNYVRLRKIDNDRARTQRQRNVLLAIANKAKSMNVFQLTTTLNTILPLITTDLSRTEILSQAANLPYYLNSSVEQVVIPHKSSSLTLVDGFEVLLIDWSDEVKYVHNVFYGDVTPSYYEK